MYLGLRFWDEKGTDLGVDTGAALLSTAPPPGHHSLELPVTHQRATRVSLEEDKFKTQSGGSQVKIFKIKVLHSHHLLHKILKNKLKRNKKYTIAN